MPSSKTELLEPFALEVELKDGTKQTIGRTCIRSTKKDSTRSMRSPLAKLHASGYLEHIYMVMASIANFTTLIDRKNERLNA